MKVCAKQMDPTFSSDYSPTKVHVTRPFFFFFCGFEDYLPWVRLNLHPNLIFTFKSILFEVVPDLRTHTLGSCSSPGSPRAFPKSSMVETRRGILCEQLSKFGALEKCDLSQLSRTASRNQWLLCFEGIQGQQNSYK